MTLEQYLNEKGYEVPAYKIGNIVRFNAPNKPKTNKSAWIMVFDNGGAVFGNWITGEEHRFIPNGKSLSSGEKSKMYLEMQIERKKYEKQQLKKHHKGSESAIKIVENSNLAQPSFPYLVKKGIYPNGALRSNIHLMGDVLVLPVYGTLSPFVGSIQSVQFIKPDGEKRFLKGARKQGGYYPVQWIEGAPIVICEGFATGATLAEHYTPFSSVICAFDSGNLLLVAKWFRHSYPTQQIIIAGDNDHLSDANVGKHKAIATAKIVGAMVSIPEFEPHEKGSDWNDRFILDGVNK